MADLTAQMEQLNQLNASLASGNDLRREGTAEIGNQTAANEGFIASIQAGFGKAIDAAKGFGGAVVKIFEGDLAPLVPSFLMPIWNLFDTVKSSVDGLFKGLFGQAKKAYAGANLALSEAREGLRDVFGNLKTNEAATVLGAFKNLTSAAGGLSQAGLSLSSVYGIGPAGAAAALKDMQEVAVALGPTLGMLGKQFEENAGDLAVYRKGLGLTAEAQASLLAVATAQGKSIAESQREFATAAVQAGKKFGISSKLIGKDMGELAKDVTKFGNLGPKALAPIVVYARKLGLEVKDLAGVMDKFADFGATAQSVSALNQAFGINIGAVKLMQEQDPAKKIDMLRKSVFAAGIDVSKLTYQEKQLLEQQTGLQGKALDLAFSLKNQALSYEDITKGAKEANLEQMTQKDLMIDLAKNIRKMVQKGKQPTADTLLGSVIEGFEQGVVKSKPYMKMMRQMSAALRTMMRAGREMGRFFVEQFPGVADTIKAIGDLFSAKKMNAMADNLKKSFKGIVDLIKDPTGLFGKNGAISKEGENLFKNLFGGLMGGPGFKDKLGALTKNLPVISKALGNFIQGALKTVGKMATDSIKNWGNKELKTAFGSGKKGEKKGIFGNIWSTISNLAEGIWDGLFGQNGAFSMIGDALFDWWIDRGQPAFVEWSTEMWLSLERSFKKWYPSIKEAFKAAWPEIKKGLIVLRNESGKFFTEEIMPGLTGQKVAGKQNWTNSAITLINKVDEHIMLPFEIYIKKRLKEVKNYFTDAIGEAMFAMAQRLSKIGAPLRMALKLAGLDLDAMQDDLVDNYIKLDEMKHEDPKWALVEKEAIDAAAKRKAAREAKREPRSWTPGDPLAMTKAATAQGTAIGAAIEDGVRQSLENSQTINTALLYTPAKQSIVNACKAGEEIGATIEEGVRQSLESSQTINTAHLYKPAKQSIVNARKAGEEIGTETADGVRHAIVRSFTSNKSAAMSVAKGMIEVKHSAAVQPLNITLSLNAKEFIKEVATVNVASKAGEETYMSFRPKPDPSVSPG